VPKKLIHSFKYAGIGANHLFRTQRNIWIHFFIGLGVVLEAIHLKVSFLEMAILSLAITFVIAVETLNTAIEEIINLVKPEQHPLAGMIKNLSAAAVLIAVGGAVAVGMLILLPRMF